MISPWVMGFSAINLAAWNNVVIGALVIIFSLWNLDKNIKN